MYQGSTVKQIVPATMISSLDSHKEPKKALIDPRKQIKSQSRMTPWLTKTGGILQVAICRGVILEFAASVAFFAMVISALVQHKLVP